MPYPNEFSCRLVAPDKVKVVGSKTREHEGRTYRIIYGIPKGGDGSVEQAYRYPKDTWTKDQAQSHCKAHDGQFEAAFEGDGLELVFMASVHTLESGDEGNLATFYLMNTAQNRNRWGVTHRALQHALPTIKRKILGCGPDHKIAKHYRMPMKVGEFIRGRMPNGYALGTAQVTDDVVWDNLKTGKWGPVSVVIGSYRDTCSKCGQVLTGRGNPWEHDCIKDKDAYVQVESFRFKRVDFINRPAYPQAGLTDLGGAAEPTVIAPLELVAGVYESQSINWTESSGRGAGSPSENSKPEEKEKKTMSELTPEQMQEKIEELQGQVTTLTSEREDFKGQLEAANETPEDDGENEELKEMKAELEAMKKERHDELVDAAVDARFKAGLAPDKDKERERMAGFTDDYLKLVTEDAEKVAQKLDESKPKGPKTKYTGAESDLLAKAIEDNRERIFGYRRDATGKVKE